MAYVKKEDLVIFNLTEGSIQALVTDIQFRRFRKAYKDKKTGTGNKFIIAGYKLRNHVMKGEKCLVLNSQYIAEFEKDGERWVKEMIAQSNKKKGVA